MNKPLALPSASNGLRRLRRPLTDFTLAAAGHSAAEQRAWVHAVPQHPAPLPADVQPIRKVPGRKERKPEQPASGAESAARAFLQAMSSIGERDADAIRAVDRVLLAAHGATKDYRLGFYEQLKASISTMASQAEGAMRRTDNQEGKNDEDHPGRHIATLDAVADYYSKTLHLIARNMNTVVDFARCLDDAQHPGEFAQISASYLREHTDTAVMYSATLRTFLLALTTAKSDPQSAPEKSSERRKRIKATG